MSVQEEISKAIGGHGLWKGRLATAVETGKSEFTPDQIDKDNLCDFGRWLYGVSIPGSIKHMPEYEACRHLHAEFHKEAAHVLRLAVGGHQREAQEAMGQRSKFMDISADLTSAMMKWRKALGA